MQPSFKMQIGDRDVTAVIRERLISLSRTDNAGHQSDSLTIRLSDDGQIAWPSKEQDILIWTGYSDPLTGEDNLVYQGVYRLDGVEFSWPDGVLVINASGARLRGSFTSPRDATWSDTTLGVITRTIAARHGFEPAISSALADIGICHLDQKGQSDCDLLARLASRFDATMKPVGNKLVLFRRGDGRSPSGQAVEAEPIRINQETRGSVRLNGRVRQKSVRANYRDLDGAAELYVETSADTPQKVLGTVFDQEADARRAVWAALHEIQRSQFELVMQRMPAVPRLRAELLVDVSGHKRAQANGEWVIKSLTETLDSSGLWQNFVASYPKQRVTEVPDPG